MLESSGSVGSVPIFVPVPKVVPKVMPIELLNSVHFPIFLCAVLKLSRRI